MRYQDTKVGNFYVVKRALEFQHASGTAFRISTGTRLQCYARQKEAGSYYYSPKINYSYFQVFAEGRATDYKIKVSSHGPLAPSHTVPDGTRRKWEQEQLQEQIKKWTVELDNCEKRTKELNRCIEEGRKRHANLASYESDTGALRAVIEDKFGKTLSESELTAIIAEAGIKLN